MIPKSVGGSLSGSSECPSSSATTPTQSPSEDNDSSVESFSSHESETSTNSKKEDKKRMSQQFLSYLVDTKDMGTQQGSNHAKVDHPKQSSTATATKAEDLESKPGHQKRSSVIHATRAEDLAEDNISREQAIQRHGRKLISL